MPPPSMHRLAVFLGALTAAAIRRPRAVVAVFAVLSCAALLVTVQGFSLQTGTEEMLDPDLQFRQTERAFKRSFPGVVDPLVLVIEAPVPEAALEAAQALERELAALDDHVEDVFRYGGPFFDRHALLFLEVDELDERINRLAEMQPLLAALADEPSLTTLFDLLASAAAEAATTGTAEPALAAALNAIADTIRSVAEGNPQAMSWQRLLGEPQAENGGDAREVLLVTLRSAPERLQPARPALNAIRALAQNVAAAHPVSIGLTGKTALNTEELAGVSRDAGIAALFSVVLVGIILAVGLRSWQFVLAALLTLLAGLALTAGFSILTIGYFNIISISFAVLFVGLGIDFAIHYLLRYREARLESLERPHALTAASRFVGPALMLCMASTALAFLAFTPTAYRGLSQLGLIAAAGVVISLTLSLTLLPSLLAALPPAASTVRASLRAPVLKLDSSGRWRLTASAILAVTACLSLPWVAFDSDPVRLKDPTTDAALLFDALSADSTNSPYVVNVVASAPAEAARRAQRLADLEETGGARWLGSFVPDEQDEKLALLDEASFFLHFEPPRDRQAVTEDPEALRAAWRDLEGALRELAAAGDRELQDAATAVLGAVEALGGVAALIDTRETLRGVLLGYLPSNLERLSSALEAGPVAADDLPPELRGRFRNPEGLFRIEVRPSGPIDEMADLNDFVAAVEENAASIAGGPVQIVRAGEVITAAMLQATGLSVALILVLLVIVVRRVREILLILLPLFLAALLAVAATVWLGIPFNFANVIVLPLLIGFGVDSAIHMVMRRRELRAGSELARTSTPRAVVLSALTTMASFGTLAFASHRGIASMGQLLCVSLAATLFAMLVFLPALLARIERKSAPA